MGEGERKPAPASLDEGRVRALVRETIQTEMTEWRLALQHILRRQEEVSNSLARLERMLPTVVGLARTNGESSPNGMEVEMRRMGLFLQKLEKSYSEGKITEVELLRGRQRIAEKIELLRRAERESEGP